MIMLKQFTQVSKSVLALAKILDKANQIAEENEFTI